LSGILGIEKNSSDRLANEGLNEEKRWSNYLNEIGMYLAFPLTWLEQTLFFENQLIM